MFENSIPTIKESEERKIKTKEILDNMNLKEYLNNDDNFIERFKNFCFELRHCNPRGSYKLFLEKFPNEKLELDCDFYNKKYFNFYNIHYNWKNIKFYVIIKKRNRK